MKRIGTLILIITLSAIAAPGQSSKYEAKARTGSRQSSPGRSSSGPGSKYATKSSVTRIDSKYTSQMVRQSCNAPFNPIAFMASWGNIANTFLAANEFSNRLSSRPSYDFQTNNPDVVVARYRGKMVELNEYVKQATAQSQASTDQSIRVLEEELANLANQENLPKRNALLDFGDKEVAIGVTQEEARTRIEQQMEQVKAEAERQLKDQLSQEMGRIKNEVVDENQQLAGQYFEAAAYEVDPGKEKYFMECRNFHQCVIDQVNREYTIYNGDWINTNCIKPGLYIGTHLSSPSDYIKVAYRKKAMYEKYGDKICMEACKMYLEAGLSVNNRDPNAYMLMSEMEDDLIQKKFYIMMATNLDQNNRNFQTMLSKVDARFTPELFSAIRQGDSRFVRKAVDNRFHVGQTYHGKSTIEQAIDYDQAAILRMLLENMDNRQAFLGSSGYALLFHAAAVDAVDCIRLLDTYGVPMSYTDGRNQGVTALNIAVRNGNGGASAYLYSKIDNYGPGLSYADRCGMEELNDFSRFLFNRSAANLDLSLIHI